MSRIKIFTPCEKLIGPEIEYKSGFWNESPSEAMGNVATFPGRCAMGQFGRMIGDGCYHTFVQSED